MKINTREMPRTCPMCGGSGEHDNDLAARVAWLRSKAKMKQEDFAKAVGVSRATIANIETGHQGMTPNSIVALCRHFGVSADWVLGLK